MFAVWKKRQVLLGLGAVIIAAGLLVSILAKTMENRATAVSGEINWGLSFQEKGKTPVGNATSKELSRYNACYVGSSEEKVIYLTFDAGFENGCTPDILDTLKKHKVKAAFFVVGNYLETCPELVKRMVEEGHLVGNHTYHHPNMSAISEKSAFEKELTSLEEKYREITGQEMEKYYRPPQGKFSESNLRQAQELGYRTVFWSLAYVDWYQDRQPSHEEAFEKLINRIHPGAVVLLHSTSQTNAEILDELLTRWEDMGYHFGTVPELFDKEKTAQK